MKAKLAVLVGITLAITAQAQQTRTLDVAGFTGIRNSTSADVQVFQSSDFKVEVTANTDVFDDLEIKVDGDVLQIKSKGKFSISRSWGKVLVKVWFPNINSLSVNGSGNCTLQTSIRTENLQVAVNGSGDIKLKEIDAKTVSVSIHGSGNVSVSENGKAAAVVVSSNGSGDTNLTRLTATTATVKLNGSGNTEISCTGELKGSVNGSGNITLYGSPLLDVKVNGSGRLIRK